MSALPRLTVIEASAGTGKTHALVERLVSLMADPAVAAEPERTPLEMKAAMLRLTAATATIRSEIMLPQK